MRQAVKSYWFWFYVAIGLISVLDFVDHITRSYSNFRDIWPKWLLFTTCVTIAVCFWIYILNLLIVKLTKRENLLQQTVVITIALLLHQYVTGPVFDLLIFGSSTLMFSFNLTALTIGLLVFYVIRLVVFLLTRKKSENVVQ